jgi:phosphatidylcholine synthase
VETDNPYRPHPDLTVRQRGQAWAVHVFTTLGIVACMLALKAVLTDQPSHAIFWLLLTLLIDGVDGPIARAVETERRVPRIDGYLLDLIIDYVACVIVPAAFMWQFDVVPKNNWGVVILSIMVFTSAIWFARKDMETPDHWFRGFPAAWNIVGPLLFIMEARTWVGASLTLVLSVLQLTSLPYPHMARARWMRKWTALGGTCWIGGIVLGMFAYPHHWYAVRLLIYIGTAYFLYLSIAKLVHDQRAKRGPSVPEGV